MDNFKETITITKDVNSIAIILVAAIPFSLQLEVLVGRILNLLFV